MTSEQISSWQSVVLGYKMRASIMLLPSFCTFLFLSRRTGRIFANTLKCIIDIIQPYLYNYIQWRQRVTSCTFALARLSVKFHPCTCTLAWLGWQTIIFMTRAIKRNYYTGDSWRLGSNYSAWIFDNVLIHWCRNRSMYEQQQHQIRLLYGRKRRAAIRLTFDLHCKAIAAGY